MTETQPTAWCGRRRDGGVRPADRRPDRELPDRAARDRPRGRRRPRHLAAAARDQPGARSPAPGSAPSRTSRRSRSTSPTSAPRPTSTRCGCALADLLGGLDTYAFVFDPYVPEVVESQLSDDLTSIATDLENGLRHYRLGNVYEALWWWQFSYVASWGNLAGAALNALLSVVAHDRLDADAPVEEEELLAVADEILESVDPERSVESLADRPRASRTAPWALSCRSTADRRSLTRPASSASHSASSTPAGPATTSSSSSRPWATRPTTCATSPSR